MRFLAWLLIHTIYRVRKEGLDNVPEKGACIVVCNHVSYVDAIVIAACVRRPIRFIMDHRIFRVPLLNWLFRTMQAIPVASAREDAGAQGGGVRDGGEGAARRRDRRHLSRRLADRRRRDGTSFGRASNGWCRKRRCPSCRWRCAACGEASSAARSTARRCAAGAACSRASRWSSRRRCRRERATPRRAARAGAGVARRRALIACRHGAGREGRHMYRAGHRHRLHRRRAWRSDGRAASQAPSSGSS